MRSLVFYEVSALLRQSPIHELASTVSIRYNHTKSLQGRDAHSALIMPLLVCSGTLPRGL
jgi:hypothetical protein